MMSLGTCLCKFLITWRVQLRHYCPKPHSNLLNEVIRPEGHTSVCSDVFLQVSRSLEGLGA